MKHLWLIAAIGCVAASAASAQMVYRCGATYTRVPCAEGKLIDVSDPVTSQRRAEALEEARREQQLGESMARERRAEAAAYRPAMAANIGPAKPAAVVAPAAKKKSKARKRVGETIDGDFIARVPKAKKAG
jgi:hypothetical protein